MKYFIHPESSSKWTQPDDAPDPRGNSTDGLSVEEVSEEEYHARTDLTEPAEDIAQRLGGLVAFSGELEFAAATEDDRTGRTVKFRIVRGPEQLREAHPFARFTRRRRGHAGTRFEASFAEIDGDSRMAFEVMLLNWSDGPQGATVTFLLPGAADTHPFMWCWRSTKERNGSRFMAALVEVDDDEALVNQDRRERVERGKKQHLSNVAAMFVKNERFHEFMRERFAMTGDRTTADAWLKGHLNIESKAELDTSTRAAAAFLRLRAAFVEWQEANGYDPTD